MENSRPGNHDRAWNDPPLFDFDTNASSATASSAKQSLKLNKRVGFDPNSNHHGSSANNPNAGEPIFKLHDAGAKPPSEGINVPPPPPSVANLKIDDATSDSHVDNHDSAEAVKVEDVISTLELTLIQCEESGKIEGKKGAEIRKRVAMFKDKWEKGQLNEKVHSGMAKLAKHLQDGKVDEAEKIQIKLNVDYPNLCTPWLIGLRQLILALK